jgi:aspartate racemase
MNKKILGILGGMGPLATAHFFQEILRWTNAKKDWDHLRIIIDNNVDIPSRTRALLYGEESPVVAMRKACFGLMDIGCDYIAVPCNSAHDFFDDVVRDDEIPWINMIEVISNELRNFENVLILGGYTTITKKTYDKYLNNTIYLQDNDMVYEIIEDAKINNTDYDRLVELYSRIKKADVKCVLLACTELPIILNELNISCETIDGNEVYIKKLIKMCGGKVKNE